MAAAPTDGTWTARNAWFLIMTTGGLFRFFGILIPGPATTITQFSELGRGANGYVFEAKACYIARNPGPRLVPLLAYFNRSSGDHFLTTSRDEIGNGLTGFEFTSTVGYVIPVDRDADRARDKGRDFYRDHH